MKFIELFAGIGGFRYGLDVVTASRRQKQQEMEPQSNMANLASKRTEQSTFTCVYANEWDKYATKIYGKHYGEIDTRDIRTVRDFPDHELLTAGFPCQAFSVAGTRKGFDDTRGTLFFEIARIAKQKQPRLLLLENVKGLLSHDRGETFYTILQTLDEIGYDLQWQVLNSKDFGVPQNRQRVFIIGNLRGTPRPEVFPITRNNGKACKELTQGVNQADRIYDKTGLSPTLPTSGGGRHEPKIGVAIQDHELKFKEMATTLDANYYKGLDNHQGRTGILDNFRIRKLTPLECERLQGFPDGWTEGLSNTQRYKCLGNAVTTTVITAIGERLWS